MIIESLLDTDLYKFTMMQLVFHHFPEAETEYEFISRTPNVDFSPYYEAIKQALEHLCECQLKDEELNYLQSLGYFQNDFLDWLKNFKLDFNYIQLTNTPEFKLHIKGPWLHTILFEVPVLAIVSEIYHGAQFQNKDFSEGKRRLKEKIQLLQNADTGAAVKFVDFGTRRRFSKQWQDGLTQQLINELPDNFVGTSNIALAKKYQLKPVGTMAHEYIQACQRLAPRLEESQKFAFYKWIEEYDGKLTLALSDVYNRYVFVNDFDKMLSEQYQGMRHDSGDPFSWGDLMIEHYHQMGIDPKTKTLVFSDSLNFHKMIEITQYFQSRINVLFGIGTHLTNDVGIDPVEIIIKMISCNGQPVGKLTDDPQKTVCPDAEFLNKLKTTFGYFEDRRFKQQ